MGDGVGAKDVSEQIQDEDQLLGAQTKEQQQQEKDDQHAPQENDGAQGVEMQGEFDGVMEDVMPDDGSEADDEEDWQQELDNEMGDTGDTGEVC